MFVTKKVLVIPTLLLILATISVLVSVGCASKNTNNSANIPSFSNADSQILTSAYTDYDSLKQSSSPDTARQELVQKLNTEKGVASATLGVDGSSIFVDYKDGYQSIVDTYEPILETQPTSSLSNDVTSNFNDVSATNMEELRPSFFLANTQQIESTASLVPQQKKALILAPIGPEGVYMNNLTTAPLDCYNYFTAHGWTSGDITLDQNTATLNDQRQTTITDVSGCLRVTPDDYFNFSNYGIILFFGHGMIKTDDLEGCYLQFSNVTKQTFDNDAQLKTWASQDQIDVSVQKQSTDGSTTLYGLYIQVALLKQLMGQLPGSYVQLATCNGSNFSSVFIDDGAAFFMSWDQPIDPVDADNNQRNMIRLMLDGKLSALDAFNDNSITRYLSLADAWKKVETGALPVNFKYFAPSSVNYYLPAWVNLKVPVLPVGISHLKVDIFDVGKNADISEDKTVTPGQTSLEVDDFGDNCFPPGPCNVSITAFDSESTTLLSNTVPFNLQVGSNDLTMSVSKFQYTLSGSQDTQTGISFSNQNQGVTALEITLNGQGLGGASSNWTGVLGFNAQPGDVLEIRIWGTTGDYHPPGTFSTSLSPLWLTSWATGEQVKITDGGNFSQYFNGAETVVFDITFTIPGSKTTTTQLSTTTTATPTNSITVTPTTGTTTETPTTTLTVTPTQTSTSLTQVSVWLTTTNDSTAPPVTTLKAGSVTTLYIWAEGGNGQTGDFTLYGILQGGTQMALGSTKHATPGNVIYCGQWNGGFLNTVGSVTVNAISGGNTVGSTTINITN